MKKTYLYEMISADQGKINCKRRPGPGYPDRTDAQADLNRLITRNTDRRKFLFFDFAEGQVPDTVVINL